MTWVKAYFGALIFFLVLDLAWILLVVKPFYARQIGQLMRESPSMGAAGAFYLFYIAGVVALAVQPALAADSVRPALINGAILGAVAYGTYTVTNFAILQGWTTGLVWSDVLWGAFLTAASAAAGFYAARLI